MSRSVSLLYRTGVKPEDKKQLFREAVKEDLNLDKILGFLSPDEKSRKKGVLQEVLLDLETDIENLNYRLDIDIKQFEASGVYDLSFALYMAAKEGFSPDSIVKNEVQMNSSKGQIFIVTGPNQGGKTTYLRAVGITQLFAQAGILVPTERAVISPVDRIYTHFSSVENTGTDRGRLEEEMILLNQIMQAVSGDSLLLMNESFSSTNSREGTIIAEEILRALSLIGTRVIFVTHLYELAKRIDSINSITNGITKLVSLVAGIERSTSSETGNPKKSIKRTYIVAPGEPLPTGYADDIAYQYGISYEELIQKTNNIR